MRKRTFWEEERTEVIEEADDTSNHSFSLLMQLAPLSYTAPSHAHTYAQMQGGVSAASPALLAS